MSDRPIYICDRFREEILVHLLRCTNPDLIVGTSQILAILGQPGTGKTYQLSHVLAENDVALVEFGANEVEDPSANKPIRMLHEKISAVSRSFAAGCPAALVIDDVDLVLGRIQATQYTHNLQRINAELMRLANRVGGAYRPLPIFMVGNDVEVLHAPLLRPGRARLFKWVPSKSEVAFMVRGLFPVLTDEEASILVAKYPDCQIAFFSLVRESLMDGYLRRLVREESHFALLRRHGRSSDSMPTLTYDLGDVLGIADGLLNGGIEDRQLGGTRLGPKGDRGHRRPVLLSPAGRAWKRRGPTRRRSRRSTRVYPRVEEGTA